MDRLMSNQPPAVSFTELKRILAKRDEEWNKVMRKLIEENALYEDTILQLQQRFGLPLSLPDRRVK